MNNDNNTTKDVMTIRRGYRDIIIWSCDRRPDFGKNENETDTVRCIFSTPKR